MDESSRQQVLDAKARQRRQSLKLVAELAPAFREQAETAIRAHLEGWIEQSRDPGPREALLGFLPLKSEPSIVSVLESVIRRGGIAVLPVIDVIDESKAGEILLRAVNDSLALRELAPGPLGTHVPVRSTPFDPAALGIALIPGVAFGTNGVRLGRGGGYFDRFLGSLPKRCARVGVAFEVQVLSDLPTEGHDALVDWLCTERGIRRVG